MRTSGRKVNGGHLCWSEGWCRSSVLVRAMMQCDRGHLRAMRLLPFAAATDKARLTLKRQVTLSLPLRCTTVDEGR